MEKITMMDHSCRLSTKLLALLALSAPLLTLTGCAAHSSDSQGGDGAGPSGTLSYQGVVTGSVTFPSADCAFDGHQHIVAFRAPHQDKYHPEIKTPGPMLSVGMVDPGAMVTFTTDHQKPTAQNTLMGLQRKDGVSFAKKDGVWVLTISALQLPDQDVMNQKFATLSGSLKCTHLINE